MSEAFARPRIVIIGRPNVGKSTLFNRLVGYRRALVHDEPGVTRDRLEVDATWWVRAQAMPVKVVDTGGLGGDRFAEEIERQVRTALGEADCVLMVFDGAAGLTPHDEELVVRMIQSGMQKRVPVIGVVNKVDAESHEERLNDFWASGIENLVTISAEHGRGIDDLQAEIAAALKYGFSDAVTALALKDGRGADFSQMSDGESESESRSDSEIGQMADTDSDSDWDSDSGELTDADWEDQLDYELEDEEDAAPAGGRKVPRVAILGRPNVGKSTLINALLGKERMITSPIAGTTVDSIDSVIELGGKQFVFIDTAGIRRKSKTEQGVEVLSIVQTRKALEGADIAILMLDGEAGTTDQDEKIAGLIEEAGVSVILSVNKWDTQRQKKDFTREVAAGVVRKKFGFMQYAPIVFMSAKEGRGIEDLGELIDDILHQRKLKLQTSELTKWVRRESAIHNPQNAKFFLAHQSGRHPPTFVVHVSDPERVHFSLRRHLVNALRERWGYMGSPVRLLFIEAKNRKSLPKNRGKKGKKPAAPPSA